MVLHERHSAWLADRGLEGVADLFGLETTQREGGNWLSVPYMEQGRAVNHKYRLTARKDHRMDTGAPLLLWNCDDIKLAAGGTLVITEGEWDGLSVKVADLDTPCVSVPNGADDRQSENPWEAVRYQWYWRHEADLNAVAKFILATDADKAGQALAADLVSLFGVERCMFITYPSGCKDLNEVLKANGQAAVLDVLAQARPYPVKGLYRFSQYPPRPPLVVVNPTLPGVKDRWPLVMGTLSVITGYSGIGKSTLLAWVKGDLLKQGVRMAVGSFETDPYVLKQKMKSVLMGIPYADGRATRPAPCDDLLEDRMILLAQHCGDDETEMDLDYMLEAARVAVLRDGVRLIVTDPWNEIEHKHDPGETEHDYTGRAIRAIKRFCRRYNVAWWMVAHPRKPGEVSHDQSRPPSLYSISGSAHWSNKADYGVVIHRPDKTNPQTQFIVTKVRMGLPGKEGMVLLGYDDWTSGYVEEGFA